jgi:hypothetical protein
VAALEASTSYEPVLNAVLLMRGDDAAKRAALACHAEKKALGALVLPPNKPCSKPIERARGFNERFE